MKSNHDQFILDALTRVNDIISSLSRVMELLERESYGEENADPVRINRTIENLSGAVRGLVDDMQLCIFKRWHEEARRRRKREYKARVNHKAADPANDRGTEGEDEGGKGDI